MDHNQQYQHQQTHPENMVGEYYQGDGDGAEKIPAEGYGQHAAPQQQYHQQQYAGGDPQAAGHQYPPAQTYPSNSSPPGMIMGMKRAVFFVVLVLLILLLGLVIGLGVGLGTTQRNLQNKESDLAAAQSAASATPTVFLTVTPGPTPTSSSSHPTGTADKYSCLSNGGTANNTRYTSSASTSQNKFRVYCGVDFGGDDGARDLDTVNTTSVADCMDACTRTRDCQGAGWGYLPGDVGDSHHCYMKANLSKSHGADKGWTFAVLVGVNVTLSKPSSS